MSVQATHQEPMQTHDPGRGFLPAAKWQSGKHQINTHARPHCVRLKPGDVRITCLWM
jgi:hypothetical protein